MLDQTQRELLETVKAEDVRFIRLSYADLFGQPKNMAIMSSGLEKALIEGMPTDASKIAGFECGEAQDLFLVPDSSTASLLPWRPAHDRVMRLLCDIRTADGAESVYSTRNLLRQAMEEAVDLGYIINAGTDCEFTLFRMDEQGHPERVPIDLGSFHDVSPQDKGEDIRRDICLALEEMGLGPQSSHHEAGHGQNEIDFRSSDVLSAADDFLTFRMAVKAVSAQHGSYASFLPKPFLDDYGNGLHINLTLLRGGRNVFQSVPEHSREGEAFIAGILAHMAEMTAFLNPIPNSYERLGALGAPERIDWGYQRRSFCVRIPASSPERVRMELRSPDPSCNLYLALALIIRAGLDGIRGSFALEKASSGTGESSAPFLPKNLGEALQIASESPFIQKSLPEKLLHEWMRRKNQEYLSYTQAADGHEHEMKHAFFRL